MTDTTEPAAFPRQTITITATGTGNNPEFIVSGNLGGAIPPVTFAVWIDGAHIQTYLTADEARLLGTTLLDAATAVQLEPEVQS